MALVKSHQALDPYMNLATTSALWIICSALSHKPCLRKTRSAYSIWAHVITFWTCSDTNKPFVRVTPRIFSTCTRCRSGIMTGAEKFAVRLLWIYLLSFAKLSLRLFLCAQCVILQSSAEREPSLTAGIITYVSSAYLQNSLPSVTACRTEAFTT